MVPFMRGLLVALFTLSVPLAASAQQPMSASDRTAALDRVRSMSACVSETNEDLARILHLVRESEEQRSRARDDRARIDADRAIDVLITRAAGVQARARQCVGGPDIPSPPSVIVRGPAPDPNAESVAQPGNTVRSVETGTELTSSIRVVRGEQVDGEGRIEPATIRDAVRRIAPRLARCYEQYLARGSIDARELELEFTVSPAGRVGGVNVARSAFGDARFDGCVRTAARALRISSAPVGGEAIFGYRLRFGR
jgi:outer membrane biosynthesis protein TonB